MSPCLFRRHPLVGVFAIAFVAATGALGLQAQNAPRLPTAFELLDHFESLEGEEVRNRVVAMAGFYGQHQPVEWRFLVGDDDERDKVWEYLMMKGKIVRKDVIRANPTLDLPSTVIPGETLRHDSDDAFHLVELSASDAGIGFESLHYQLRARPSDGEAIWIVRANDLTRRTVGVVFVSAESGEVLSERWFEANSPEYLSQNPGITTVTRYLDRGQRRVEDILESLDGDLGAKGGEDDPLKATPVKPVRSENSPGEPGSGEASDPIKARPIQSSNRESSEE